MLGTRIATAVVLLALLVPVLWSGSLLLVGLVLVALFGAAAWEMLRLFGRPRPLPKAALWALVFALLLILAEYGMMQLWPLYFLCAAIWLLRLLPGLKFGLPPAGGLSDRVAMSLYGLALMGCFAGMGALYRVSALYLLSVLALVWVADIGAYFVGRAFGKRKLAPSISPGKSWEGALGGWLAVLAAGMACASVAALAGTFPARVAAGWGWTGLVLVLSLLTAASVIGDLVESQLKRRAGFKDSSNLLPGHGGVLDRIDALIPVVPLAVIFHAWI